MASKTDIANLALQRVGAKRIMDIDSETEKGARVVRNVFEDAVKEVSALSQWNALTTRVSLGLLTSTPAFTWDYEYQLPSDYIRMVEFNREDVWDETRELYDIEDGKLLTDADTANIRYVRYVEDSTKYPPLFVQALSVNIAAKIAIPMRQDEELAVSLTNEFNRILLPRARRIDGADKKRRQYNPCEGSRILKARLYSTNG